MSNQNERVLNYLHRKRKEAEVTESQDSGAEIISIYKKVTGVFQNDS